jgi:hypothetical protein
MGKFQVFILFVIMFCAGGLLITILFAIVTRDKKRECDHKFGIDDIMDLDAEPKCEKCNKYLKDLTL